jgi:hypothetical protein
VVEEESEKTGEGGRGDGEREGEREVERRDFVECKNMVGIEYAAAFIFVWWYHAKQGRARPTAKP